MKTSVKRAVWLTIGLILLLPQISHSNAGGLIRGNEIGEIYFTGPTPYYYGASGLYHSTDNGQQITLQFSDSTDDFIGSLLSDACDSCLYLLKTGDEQSLRLSNNDGLSWTTVSNQVFGNGSVYDAGIVAGEIYRPINDLGSGIERSTNYGYSFTPCAAIGLPDTSWIYSLALGSIAGEVYLLTCWNDYYYSADSGESFTYLGNLWQAGAPNYSYLISGSQVDEMYLFHYDSQCLYQITQQGQSVTLAEDFDLPNWSLWPSAGKEPGRLYVRANWFNLGNYGGVIRIYTSDNSGNSWTMVEHLINTNGVQPVNPALPQTQSLALWPNPTNSRLNIGWWCNFHGLLDLRIYNPSGRVVYQTNSFTAYGYWEKQLDLENFPSGLYLVKLITQSGVVNKSFCLLK